MQVNQVSEFVTHAVISGTKQINMGISDNAEFFQILSSTLYSDQLLAVVRETTCNAWDAHVDSNRKNTPIQITISRDKVIIRDFGTGIHHDLMGPIYGIYGASTKKNDGLQTGGFGLGCKAPFAYTDHFQVTSNHEGIKTIYSMSKSSAQVGGKPAIIPITSLPTEDKGLEVSINIKIEDMPRFLKLFKLIVRNGEMNAEINGIRAETLPFSEAKNGFMILPRTVMHEEKSSNTICVRYGNVIYPLPNHPDINDYRVLSTMLDKLPRSSQYGGNQNTLVLLAPPHSISVTPSREALSMQEHTVNTVNTLIKNFVDYMTQKDFYLEKTLIAESIQKATISELLDANYKLTKHSFNIHAWQADNLRIIDYKLYRRATRSMRSTYSVDKKELLARVKKADSLSMFIRGKAHSLYRAIQRTAEEDLTGQTTWVDKHIIKPLARKMKLNPEMNISRLFFTGSLECKPVIPISRVITAVGNPLNIPHKFTCEWSKAAKHARPYIVIHYVRKDIHHRIVKEGTLKNDFKDEVLFYHVPRTVAKVQVAIDFFTAEGYKIIDLTKPLPGETIESVEPVVRIASGTRQQGLIALSDANDCGSFQGDKVFRESAKRTTTAECVFLCTNTDNHRRSNKLGFFGDVSSIVMELYGDVAGIAKTTDQYDRYQKKGIKDGITYVTEDVINYISESDLLLQHLTSKRTLRDCNFTERIYKLLVESKVVCDMFNLPFITEKEDKLYLSLWEFLLHNRRHNNEVETTQRDILSLPVHKATLNICNKIAKSKYFLFLETSTYMYQGVFDEHILDFLNFINQ